MLNDRTTRSALALLAAVFGVGCSAGEGSSEMPRTLVAEESHARCGASADRRSLSKDPTDCRHMLFVCAPGETPFFDACGCGCERR
ncbi:hypothetical protein OWM54_09055 [Myxococcus sp. MISCRS1]|uniref:hypothetical protein n=1 Tax=Myxococcus TaxID=32 RepID=UPI001CC15958|nr:hypothetical protein [Myxococcus sp. MISCRS1]MBZ4400543.1 hypothetical protein [Myxococcus sp. AS-1-15]MBZ4412883.1 hypothetical protein [Myxococcus sp. XM-1-1-1]MCY0997287.1 hypothetical protein [Myxococcus sp. MISCRS1]BDT32697.1 hypothetical protein MFMH1_23660 [Myxococcus sp. MH1]